MKEQGYATAIFGKWHLGYDPKFNPVHQGFDEYRGFVSGNVDYQHKIDQEGHKDWWVADKLEHEDGYVTDLVTQHGIAFIESNRDKPFFLALTHGAPHYPLQARDDPGFRIIGKSNRQQPPNPVADPKIAYQKMVEAIDEGVGEIVAKLEQLAIRDNTLIVFCSDNGPAAIGHSGGLRGGKGTLYEGGHRVCGIFNWPAKLTEPHESDHTILTMDLMPTFVSMAGGEVSADRHLDGVNILPALTGQDLSRDYLFWGHGNDVAVRNGKWKLILRGSGKVELFDLEQDRNEQHEISSAHESKVTELTGKIQEWLSDSEH